MLKRSDEEGTPLVVSIPYVAVKEPTKKGGPSLVAVPVLSVRYKNIKENVMGIPYAHSSVFSLSRCL